MASFAIRIFIFTIFPLILAWWVKRIDQSVKTPERTHELTLILLFGIGVAGSGIFNFFAHFFISDIVAESIGWESGNPFQLEVAFANLALGILGVIATSRRDGFREATVIAVTIFSLGATVVHIMDIVSAGNLAPGNTIQNLGNILKPAILIWFLVRLRRTEAATKPESSFDGWRAPLLASSGLLAVAVSTGYGVGYAVNQVWLYSLLGAVISVGILTAAISRSAAHELIWKK